MAKNTLTLVLNATLHPLPRQRFGDRATTNQPCVLPDNREQVWWEAPCRAHSSPSKAANLIYYREVNNVSII